MVGVKSLYEDTYGTTPNDSELCECAECGRELNYDQDYFVHGDDASYCRDCIGSWDLEQVTKFLGYATTFDLIYDVKN